MQLPPIKQLADKCGYTYTHVKRVLNGQNDPSLKCARVLSACLGVSLDKLVSHIDSQLSLRPVALWPPEDE